MTIYFLDTGTATLDDLLGNTQPVERVDGRPLKKTADGIILVPQPSDSPDDPLNWPLWQRDVITFLLCLLSVLASTLSPLLAANTITLMAYYEYKYGVTDMALLTGWHLFAVGVAGFFMVPLARVWGKRWLILLGTVIIIVSSIWGGFSGKSYNSLVAARAFQGVGLAPFEGLVNAMVGELYYVHESGARMALSNLCLFGGAFFTPVIVGKATSTLGWEWTFFMVAIFTAVTLPLVFLFCPETTYNRDIETDTCDLVSRPVSKPTSVDAEKQEFAVKDGALGSFSSIAKSDGNPSSTSVERVRTNSYTPYPHTEHMPKRKMLTAQNFKIFTGRKSNENFWKLLVRPLPLLFQPAFLWAAMVQGAMIAWVAMMGVSLAILTIKINFTEVETGYMYAGAFIGAILAFVMAGAISDPMARWMTRRNNGVFEPEFRMILVIPMLIFGVSGLFGFGVFSADSIYGWLLPDVMFGFVVGGMTLGAIVSAQYIIDGYRDLTVEGLTVLVVFKNFICFAITYKGFDWFIALGSKEMFFMFGYIQIAICASTIPMYIFGKKNRSFFARHDLLELLHLK